MNTYFGQSESTRSSNALEVNLHVKTSICSSVKSAHFLNCLHTQRRLNTSQIGNQSRIECPMSRGTKRHDIIKYPRFLSHDKGKHFLSQSNNASGREKRTVQKTKRNLQEKVKGKILHLIIKNTVENWYLKKRTQT